MVGKYARHIPSARVRVHPSIYVFYLADMSKGRGRGKKSYSPPPSISESSSDDFEIGIGIGGAAAGAGAGAGESTWHWLLLPRRRVGGLGGEGMAAVISLPDTDLQRLW